MKRTKQQQTIISLSSKRQSLQQDCLTRAHQKEWNPPLQTVDGNHSKAFFANMKAQLSNIRSDYERLIQREDKTLSLTLKEKQMIQQKTAYGTAEKVKSYSSYKQEDRYLTQKKIEPESISKNEFSAEHAMKGFNLGKNFSEAVNFKNMHISGREKEPYIGYNPVNKYIAIQAKEKQVKQQNYASVNTKKYSSNFNQSFSEKELLLQRIQLQRQKDFTNKLQQQMATYKVDANRSKTQLSRMSEQNTLLKQKIDVLQKQNAEKAQKVKVDDQILAKYKSIAGKIEQNQKLLAEKERQLIDMQEQRDKQKHFLQEKINELTFYNNNFYTENVHLVVENHQLKDFITNIQKINQDNQRLAAQSEHQWQHKLDHLERNVNEYEKRESMFQKEIERLCLQINTQTTLPIDQCNHKEYPQQTAQNIRFLECQLSKQREINQLISQRYKSQLQKLNIQAITSSLQQTIQRLTDQNAKLKRQVNSLTSKISSLQEQNNAYCHQIKLYEERDKFMHVNRSLTTTQWEEMTEKIESLQAENKRLREDEDYKELIQDVLTQKYTFDVAFEMKEQFETAVKTAKDQLQEIQKLRSQVQKLRNKLRICEQERKEVISHKIQLEDQLKTFLTCQATSQNTKIMEKCDHLRNKFQQKEQELRKVKQLMRSSLFPERDDTDFY